jgi:hypothetical protein
VTFSVEEGDYCPSPLFGFVEVSHVPGRLDHGQLRVRHLAMEPLGYLDRKGYVLGTMENQDPAGEVAKNLYGITGPPRM